MKKHHVLQGSPEWLALRAAPMTATASDAPVMMGVSPHMTRTELLNQKVTGITREVSDFMQDIYDKGHEAEAAFRPLAEDMIGDDLYPVTGTIELDGITFLASFDGLTMSRADGFEHKVFNAETAGHIALEGEPPEHHVWQLEQQLLVADAQRILFVTSDGTAEHCETCTYTSRPERRARLIAAWKRFFADLETHTPIAKTVKVEAEVVEHLPAVSVRMDGQIIVSSNLDVFSRRLRDFVARLVLEPETDQDFANCEAAVKALEKAEEALDAAEAGAIAQVESVETMRTTVAELRDLARKNRLVLSKAVAARKEAIKVETVTNAQKALVDHIMALNMRIGRPLMPRITADIAGAIKGKKSVDTLKEAARTELSRAKTEADMMADRITANLKVVGDTELPHLFADLAALVVRDPADVAVLVEARVTTHRAAEAKRLEEERAAIRAEEAARVERENRERQEAEDKAVAGIWEAARRIEGKSAGYVVRTMGNLKTIAENYKNDPRPRIAETIEAARAELDGKLVEAQEHDAQVKTQIEQQQRTLDQVEDAAIVAAPRVEQQVEQRPAVGAASPRYIPHFAPAGRAAANGPEDDGVRIKLGELNTLLAPISITADGLATLGFHPATVDKNAKLYRECDIPAICQALVRHVNQCMTERLLAA